MTHLNNFVIYVRHAESEANTIIHENKKKGKTSLSASQEIIFHSFADPKITSTGIEQSKTTAKYLFDQLRKMNKTNITVFLSPMRRAQETGKYFIECFKDTQITVKVLNELQEYTSTDVIFDEQHAHLIKHESKEQFYHQVMKFNDLLHEELKTHTPEHALIIFGHSLFFSSLLSYHIQHEKNKITDVSSLQLPNCSISCESYNPKDKTWKTFMIGHTSHLPKEIMTGTHVFL